MTVKNNPPCSGFCFCRIRWGKYYLRKNRRGVENFVFPSFIRWWRRLVAQSSLPPPFRNSRFEGRQRIGMSPMGSTAGLPSGEPFHRLAPSPKNIWKTAQASWKTLQLKSPTTKAVDNTNVHLRFLKGYQVNYVTTVAYPLTLNFLGLPLSLYLNR